MVNLDENEAYGIHPLNLLNRDEIMTSSMQTGSADIPVYVSVGTLAGCAGPVGNAWMGVTLGKRWCVGDGDCLDDDTCFKPAEVHGGNEIVGVLPGYCAARAIIPGGVGGGGDQGPSDPGLSDGAIAGIAVGGTVAAAGIAYVGFQAVNGNLFNGQKKGNSLMIV